MPSQKEVKSRSSPCSSNMHDAGPSQSVFVVVSYDHEAAPYSSILQLDKEGNSHDYVAHFKHPQPQGYPQVTWVFSRLARSSEDLCFVPDWCTSEDYKINVPLHGCIYNLRTNECKSIKPLRTKPPGEGQLYRYVVALGVYLYFMGTPGDKEDVPEAIFQRYNRVTDSWETLTPFPSDCGISLILACAVWDDTVLLNMDGCGMWAYAVGRDQWCRVVDEEKLCNDIVGKAVVLGNIIYFLGNMDDIVVALSLKKEEINGDLVFECSLRFKITVPGMDEIKFEQVNTCRRTRDLVHLGKDKFCIVRSCSSFDSIQYQPIQLTNMKLKRKNSMTVTDTCVHYIEIVQNQQFEVRICFSPLSPEGFDPNQAQEDEEELEEEAELETGHSIDVRKLPPNGASAESRSIYVRKLSPDATVRQLEKGLANFGPIKRNGIQLLKNKKGKCFAYVEFERVSSKQRAIETSTVRIGGYSAEIMEKSEEPASTTGRYSRKLQVVEQLHHASNPFNDTILQPPHCVKKGQRRLRKKKNQSKPEEKKKKKKSAFKILVSEKSFILESYNTKDFILTQRNMLPVLK